ncbi:MAG: hypothetical protein IT317_10895 [Anaerolineales bacterium]|nr:hypothetical protein [Anaerolineales bacterium]
MRSARVMGLALLCAAVGVLACAGLTPGGAATEAPPTTESALAGTPAATAAAATEVPATAAEPSPVPATPTEKATLPPTLTPAPTEAPLALEIVQTQVWLDANHSNARANVLFRNPYDFPVSLKYDAYAALYNAAGDLLRQDRLYFLDGISGGGGYLQPGETVAANACFTCEEALLSEPWDSMKVTAAIVDATGRWNVVTEVTPTLASVEFDPANAIFWISGTVKNNTANPVQRISVRVIVYDPDGKLIGAAEGSAWDVPAGATVTFSSYGLGEASAGQYTTEVTALGVNY